MAGSPSKELQAASHGGAMDTIPCLNENKIIIWVIIAGCDKPQIDSGSMRGNSGVNPAIAGISANLPAGFQFHQISSPISFLDPGELM